jgi:transcriptional regulator with XRE-family HTH domain
MGVEIFAQRIKTLREANGLSTRGMGEELGVSHVSISYYENCKREPTLSIMEAYAKYFNVTVDYLIGLSDNRR